ncbi:hypothetical protein ERJ70_18010 [Sediminibacillus dalangtanensis]|uniref:Lipoprotein n=1 Tax=Sediminibacillus dalangtanensis TaxID=2729421 RepID=A0ABX7VZ47_9BACI|nr:membrane lipoprotein lipid attachment site-containing protein [Sediminibacillus dalangtanensis]QTN01016.1 hypothetical protein ERJ70_18010 [Sediminibacillus dalangtanensis]
MKKYLFTFSILLVLFGCSNNPPEESANHSENQSPNNQSELEEDIQTMMEDHDYLAENIIDYEIKDDFVYVFSYIRQTGLSVAVLKTNAGSLEWIMEEKSIETVSLGDPDVNSPVLTVVQSDNPNVKNVKVEGNNAKLIKQTVELADDYNKEVAFWIHFSEMNEDFKDLKNLPSEDVEYID